MPVTQRQQDIMRLQAQITILKIVEDWKKQFLRGRLPAASPVEETEQPPMMEEPIPSMEGYTNA